MSHRNKTECPVTELNLLKKIHHRMMNAVSSLPSDRGGIAASGMPAGTRVKIMRANRPMFPEQQATGGTSAPEIRAGTA
jgi:hypothetical protein